MPKYKQGTLEQAIKDLIADYFEEILGKAKQIDEQQEGKEEQEDESEEGIRRRGRVRDPEHDKRLKDNR